MTTDEYRDLIAFLGTKFSEVDAQFRAVDARFQRVEVGSRAGWAGSVGG